MDIVLNNIHKRANILVSGKNCSSKEKKIIKPLMHSHTFQIQNIDEDFCGMQLSLHTGTQRYTFFSQLEYIPYLIIR